VTTLNFALHNLKRLKSDFASLFFNIALPVVLYLIFGASQPDGEAEIANGNMAAYVMLAMALYAGVSGAVSQASTVVVEQSTGWGRQLALTPLSDTQLTAARFLVVLIHVALPVAAVFLAGAVTKAQMEPWTWLWTYLITVAVALPFGFYGRIWAQAMRSYTAVSIAATSVVLLAIAANLLIPLTEDLLSFARFTPLYGAAVLSRWPLTEGEQFVQTDPYWVTDPLWVPAVSIIFWTALFTLTSLALDRREKHRA